jgi:5'(3')-deoxyribonucleotidase
MSLVKVKKAEVVGWRIMDSKRHYFTMDNNKISSLCGDVSLFRGDLMVSPGAQGVTCVVCNSRKRRL